MKVVLSTIGKFHTFDLARELYRHNALTGIFTGYPMFKLAGENLPQSVIHSFPYLHAPYMRFPLWKLMGATFKREWEYLDRVSFDWYVSKRIPECDIFSGLSGTAINTGRIVKSRGGKYVCDRGSSHIRTQDQILKEEHERWGIKYRPIDPRIIAREESEYALADAITVPSHFVYQSFIERGVPEEKLRLIPYGVNLEKFHPTSTPEHNRFDVLFVGAISLRKGIPDLLQAFRLLAHKNKRLTLVGSMDRNTMDFLQKHGLLDNDIRLTGHIPQSLLKETMSKSHVMVLPSLEEGLAMVQAQAMACGCPVIATTNTGASNLFNDGVEGYIVPIRSPEAIAERLQILADNSDTQFNMSQAASKRVRSLGGWMSYGEAAINSFNNLLAH